MSDDGEASDGARGPYPERESIANFDYDRPSMRNVVGVPVFKQTVPIYSGTVSYTHLTLPTTPYV